MINDDFWRSIFGIAFLFGPFVMMTIGLAYNFYLINRHLDAILGYLSKSRHSHTWAPVLRAQGIAGSSILLARIAGMIFAPRFFIKLGELDKNDVENFPRQLKRKLARVVVLIVGGCLWMTLVAILICLTKANR